MGVREEFVLRALEPGVVFARLCRETEISRKTGYKWLERYRERGVRGLEDMSRRPHASPLRVSADIVAEVVAMRHAHPRWGARKIAATLRRRFAQDEIPKERTIVRILVRAGLVQVGRRRRRAQRPAAIAPAPSPKRPNDLWTADFKGWWRTQDHQRCEPLTIRDAFSRFLLKLEALETTRGDAVRAAFAKTFEIYGIPAAILTDNGPPFAVSHSALGLTMLSAWWLSLGIEVLRTRPATPSDNGGHERLHRDIADELEAFAALTKRSQQDAFDRWRHDFNHHRPHEALGMRVPADVYRRSEVVFEDKPVELLYPERFHVRTVTGNGRIIHQQRDVFVSLALARQRIGLDPLGHGRCAIWFAAKLLGTADFSTETPTFEPATWNPQRMTGGVVADGTTSCSGK